MVRHRHRGLEVTCRDWAADPIGQLTVAHLAALRGVMPETAGLAQDIAAGQPRSTNFAADVVVIGAPMYNFSIPTQLKAWIDRITVSDRTFRVTENGPEGLARGKRVIVAASRGGFYGPDRPGAFLDHQETYLRSALELLGTEVTFIRGEGVALGPVHRAGHRRGQGRDWPTLRL